MSDHPTGSAAKALPAGRESLVELVSALLDVWVAIARGVTVTGNIAWAALLAARIWLSQAVFVHQIMMMMMHAEGFTETPSAGATLIRAGAPLLLATGLMTRPVALILALGIGQDLAATHLTSPRTILFIWLIMAGAGPFSVDFLLRGGLARVPVWAVRVVSRLYALGDALADFTLPLGTRIYLALAVASGTGFAMWRVPLTGELVTAPWWLLLLCWALLLGLATRPVALLLSALAPPILVAGVAPDRFEVTILLLLLAAKGAGWLSLDYAAARCAGAALPKQDRSDEALPHVVNRRRRIWRHRRRTHASLDLVPDHTHRPAKSLPVPATALPGRDRRPVARRHRSPHPQHSAAPTKRRCSSQRSGRRGPGRARSSSPGRAHSVRQSHSRDGRSAQLFRPRRVGSACTRTEEHRGRHGDAQSHAPGVRTGRERGRPD